MKLFNAVLGNKSVIGKGSTEDLVDWLEKYINILYPENGIDYWRVEAIRHSKNELIRSDPFPGDRKFNHFACYAYEGNCEGERIEVAFRDRESGDTISICTLKSFAGMEMAWKLAAAINDVLFSIYAWEQIPSIVDMWESIPRKRPQSIWSRETTLTHPVEIQASKYAIKVTSGDTVLSDIVVLDFNMTHHAEAMKKDWITLLTNMDIKFSLVEEALIPA